MQNRLIFLLLCLLPSLLPAQEHTHADGTTHAAHEDEPAAGPSPKLGATHFTAYAESDKYELTLYYPELVAGQEAHLTLFIADYSSNRPIEGAELSISTSADVPTTLTTSPISAGVYELHGSFPKNQTYTLNVQISHANGPDLIGLAGVAVGTKLGLEATADSEPHTHTPWPWFVGGLLLGGLGMWFVGRRRSRVLTTLLLLASGWISAPNWNPAFAHGDEVHGPEEGGSGYGKSVETPKETQFLFEILTQPIAIGDYQSATSMFGTIVPAAGGLGVVVAPQSGRLSQVKVSVGQSVRAGQILAVLQQNIGTPEQVAITSNNADLALQIETAKVRAEASKRELDRLQQIADIAAGRDLQLAEANYRQALAELQSLESKTEANRSANSRTLTLVAPISGIVGAFTLSTGAEVVAGQTLFTLTNLSTVYVEAQVYDRDVAVIQAGNKFLVTCSTDSHKSAEVRLLSQAQSMNPGNQSQRVLFEMDNPKGEFKIGEFVSLKALNQQTSRQISIPNSALTEINGKTAVFIKISPEAFMLSYVQTGEDDGTRTLVLKGIEEAEKVVVNGAYELKMMYLNQ